MTIKEMREKHGGLIKDMETIFDGATKEKRSLSDDERQQFDSLEKEANGLAGDIERFERQRAMNASTTFNEKEKEAAASYSFKRAIMGAMNGKLDGLEAEMHQEGILEARNSGLQIEGNLYIPFHILSQKRTQTSMNATTTAEGKATVATEMRSLIDILRDRMNLSRMGATYLTGLNGNISFPRHTASTTASWKAEATDADSTYLTFDNVELTPNKLTAHTKYSKQLLIQSSVDIESLVRNDLALRIAHALETAAINGTGLNNQPTGILNTTGIGSVVGGTNGANFSWTHAVQLENAIEVENADMGALAYYTNPRIKGYGKTAVKATEQGGFIIESDNTLNGYPLYVSNIIPSDLEKGTHNYANAVIFGNWADLLIGQWGGLDLLIDPYTSGKAGMINVYAVSFWDVDVRHAESFAAMKDALAGTFSGTAS
jgi:HK97 family phage major capsid protein